MWSNPNISLEPRLECAGRFFRFVSSCIHEYEHKLRNDWTITLGNCSQMEPGNNVYIRHNARKETLVSPKPINVLLLLLKRFLNFTAISSPILQSEIELKQKFSFSSFRENFHFSHQNLTKIRENYCKYIYKLRK
jgi:hypothetical protein